MNVARWVTPRSQDRLTTAFEVWVELKADCAPVDEHEPLIELRRAPTDLLGFNEPDELPLEPYGPPEVSIRAGQRWSRFSGQAGGHGDEGTSYHRHALARVLDSLWSQRRHRARGRGRSPRSSLATSHGRSAPALARVAVRLEKLLAVAAAASTKRSCLAAIRSGHQR